MNILRKLRDINVDYHHVGWYQSTYLSSHVTKEFLESHYRYQMAIEESVVLIYGESASNFALRPTLSVLKYYNSDQNLEKYTGFANNEPHNIKLCIEW